MTSYSILERKNERNEERLFMNHIISKRENVKILK